VAIATMRADTSGYIRGLTPKLSEVAQKLVRFLLSPNFLGKRPPIFELRSQRYPCSDHVAKFHEDR